MWKGPVHETPLTANSRAAVSSHAVTKGSVLYTSEDCQDFVWKKVFLVASLVGEPIESIKLTAADFATLAPHARGCALAPKGVAGGGVVAGPNACCRYLAGLREDLALFGATDFDAAKVEQYVEFSWYRLEVLVGACTLPVRPGEPPSDKNKIAALASKDCLSALSALNTALISSTFLAGKSASSGPTLADACAGVAVAEIVTAVPALLQGANLGKAMPHLCRWFLTCAHHPSFLAVLGPSPAALFKDLLGKDLKPPQSVAIQPAAAAGGGGGGGGKKTSGSAAASGGELKVGSAQAAALAALESVPALALKFSRERTRIKDVMNCVESGGGKSGAAAAAAQAPVELGAFVVVKGWARTVRSANKGKLLFVVLNDGSTAHDLQCVVSSDCPGFEAAQPAKCGGTGASFSVEGVVVASLGGQQAVEVQASKVVVLGAVFAGEGKAEDGGLAVGGAKYPLAKKGHSLEYLRTLAHLRPRTKAYASTQRLRNAMAYATHSFFHARGFLYVHTPLITGADCEGAGEMFAVTTLLPKDPKGDLPRVEKGAAKGGLAGEVGDVDYSKDFFGAQAGLTVSGQLNVETHCCALSDVYTFGPTFRAEDSHTNRHLAEFWMIEPEIAFATLQQDMDLAEDYLKHCVHHALTECMDDLLVLQAVEDWDGDLVARLKQLLAKPFARVTYTEAIETLQQHVAQGLAPPFENKDIEWGMDMASEHERYLAESVFKGPIICTNYPKAIKAFYMKLDEGTAPGRETVQAMDILVPRIGEIIGGSAREDDHATLLSRANEMGVSEEQLSWYLDLRKYGTCPHAGFGLGFERLVMLVTGVENIRDTIPFPRYPGHCDF